MRIGVLGTTIAVVDRTTIALGGPKQRALLAALALHHGRAVSVDELADLVWDGTPPAGVANTVQGYVAGLRRALEPSRSARAAGTLLVTEQPGYALRLGDDALDTTAFEQKAATAHAATAPLAASLLQPEPGRPAVTAAALVELQATLSDALALWRATPFADLGDSATVAAERARLEELRLLAQEDRAVVGLLLGRHAPVSAELEALTRQHPLRERLWALRAVALAGSGRQADALAVLREVRDLLDDELALEPGPELRAVQASVLRQQQTPTVEGWSPASVPAPLAPSRTRTAAPWPLAGRAAELESLTSVLDAVCAGQGPAFAALTGEPGIGKTRLASELVAYASARDVRVVVGRCSQDDGAPALWPWATILGELGAELPTSSGGNDEGSAFRAWQSIIGTLVQAAATPLLVVLDDLHWADTSTLRVLRLLGESALEPAAMMVLATWREHPAPSGPLADVAETFARRHALRLQLRGLAAPDAAQIVRQVASAEPTPAEVEALTRRTDGNPFFLVEYARLAGDGGELAGLLDEAAPPVAVQEVLTRRLARLDAATRDLVCHASIVGRVFEIDVLAAITGTSEDEVLDALEPALEAGLIAEDGVDRFRFTHALVRDSARASVPESRRARVHARTADALAARPGRETEIARHWLAAGPRHNARAWRAAARAAGAAAAVHAPVEALEMLEHALRGQRQDPDSGPAERFEVLADLADVLRRSGRWLELRDVAHEALDVADEVGDIDLKVRASIMTSTGALWQSAADGKIDELMVEALRAILAELPTGDDERRVRVMLALAGETYYGTSPAEREALAEEAVAMAERLGEPELTLWACLHAVISVWRGGTAELRHSLSGTAMKLAAQLDDEMSLVAATTLRAVAAGELGLVDELEDLSAEARTAAEELRHLYALLVLDSLDVPWLAMRGQTEEVAARIEHMVELSSMVTVTGAEESVAGALTMQLMWEDRNDEMLGALSMLDGDTFLPIDTSLVAVMCRAGKLDEARERFRRGRQEIYAVLESDSWYSPMNWSLAAEVALHLEDPDLAARAYERLTPLAGRPAGAGTGTTIGPVDAFLALAAAATGERELAAKHADHAEELCELWRIPLAAHWVRRERERWGF